MKKETISNLWAIGTIILALSILIPFPWIEIKVVNADHPDVIVYQGLSPASDIKSSNGPLFTLTLILICGAIIVGFISALDLFRWSLDKKDRPWYWGEITLALTISAITVWIKLNFDKNHSLYGLQGQIGSDLVPGDPNYYIVSWYPQIGFYLVIVSLIILIITQLFARGIHLRIVREDINI